jgi:AP2 domain
MKTITLTQGKVAFVDDADFEWLSQWKWQAVLDGHTYYAVRTDYSGDRPRRISMHRLIMGEPKGKVDHKDGEGLNNQRGNLRPATDSENQWNRRKSRGCSSIYMGVSWRKDYKHWEAQIVRLRVKRHLGYFDSELEAARAYDKAAKELHGSFIRPNFP